MLYVDHINSGVHVTRTEFAFWIAPGEGTQRGTVVQRGKSATAAVTVSWENGRTEKVRPADVGVLFAFEGSARLHWILDRQVLEKRFKEEPANVVVDVIRDQGGPITGAAVKKQLTSLGLSAAKVDSAVEKAKPLLKKNLHIVSKGVNFTWSDVEVDPYAYLRSMTPDDALDHLMFKPRLKSDEKLALADAIRAGFQK